MIIVDCKWSQYGDWSSCSSSCGESRKAKARYQIQAALYGGKDCEGDSKMFEACDLEPCPGIDFNHNFNL